jgi:hypothetical protein
MLYEIWSEGYRFSGEEGGGAICWGKIEANSFKEACDKLAEKNRCFRECYRPEQMTYWSCRLFDNEADARKSFG